MMEPFKRLTAVAAPIEGADMETDILFPSRFLKKPLGPEYAAYLFHDLRFHADGTERVDFVLNQSPCRAATILVANRNFGCGSAREGAVYALVEYGIRVVIAPSFGDIFYYNCLTNGLLAVRLEAGPVADLRRRLKESPGTRLSVDLEARTVTAPDGAQYSFEIDSAWRRRLIEGLDGIDLTLGHAAAIDAFEERYRAEMGWLFKDAL
ncbi:MAG: 3-isopropylmalate dehydratase small subunit [Rhodospirillales bacterium]|jgi:3-isopropylmalate/(R)-2-methylmalate dehydratase small subunit|nr:3-isopropylmalate dehydratase small subunit [Rhodospirillales bacterium]